MARPPTEEERARILEEFAAARERFHDHVMCAVNKFDCERAAQVFALFGWTWSGVAGIPNAEQIRAHLVDLANGVVDGVVRTGGSYSSRCGRMCVWLEFDGSSHWDAGCSLSMEAEEYGNTLQLLPYPVSYDGDDLIDGDEASKAGE